MTGAPAQPSPVANPGVPARGRPLLRGWFHAVAVVGALPAAAWLVSESGSRIAAVGAGVYGASLVLLFAVSATYHRVLWTDARIRSFVGRVDHSAIFLLIAGTYTPFCLLIGAWTGYALLATVWASASVGILLVVFFPRTPKPVRAALYVLLGWLIVPFLPALYGALGPRPFLLLLVGGAFYTVGAVIYASRRPDPFPRVFGFHEIFHVLVVAASVCQFIAVAAAVRAMATGG
jgi:hemolysin III